LLEILPEYQAGDVGGEVIHTLIESNSKFEVSDVWGKAGDRLIEKCAKS